MGLLRERARDGREHFGCALDQYAADGLLAQLAQRFGVRVPPLSEVSDAPPAVAYVHWDRWVVTCPACSPPDTQYVWIEQPLFLCSACWNRDIGGLWRRVKLPDERTRRAIEATLGHRADLRDRNWSGAPLSVLRLENFYNGESFPFEDDR